MIFIVSGFVFLDDKLLLIFHKKMQTWLPVGGHVEQNESFDDALLREIKEEVNLNVEILDPYRLNKCYPNVFPLHRPFFMHTGLENGLSKTWINYICIAKNIDGISLRDNEVASYALFTKKKAIMATKIPLLKSVIDEAFLLILTNTER